MLCNPYTQFRQHINMGQAISVCGDKNLNLEVHALQYVYTDPESVPVLLERRETISSHIFF